MHVIRAERTIGRKLSVHYGPSGPSGGTCLDLLLVKHHQLCDGEGIFICMPCGFSSRLNIVV